MMTPAPFRPFGVHRLAFAMAAALATVLLPVCAAGQTAPRVTPVAQADRPYRGLFGAGTGAVPGGHLLALSATVYEEYGTNAQGGDLPVTDGSVVLREGWFLGVRGQLGFEKAGRYSRIALRGEGAFRYVREVNETTSPRYRAEVAIDTRSGARKQNIFHFTGAAEFEPYYILSIFPVTVAETGDTAIVPTNRDDLLFKRTRHIYTQGFSYEQQLSSRSYLTVYEDWRKTQAQSAEAAFDVDDVRVGARYGYRLSPAASFRLGYGYRIGNYGLNAAQRFEAHDIDLSIDYRKALSRSKATTFGFGAGTSRISRDPEPLWTVVGSANLRHEFGRGWFVQADYRRDAQLVEGFADPFFVNTITGSLGGFLGHRVEVLAASGYSKGPVGFGANRYNSRQSSARLRWGLAKYVAIDAEGLMVNYDLGDAVTVPGTVPAVLDRWAVRCNVAVWLPLSR